MTQIPLVPISGPGLQNGQTLNAIINQLNASYQWPGNFYYCDPSKVNNGNGGVNTPYNSLPLAYAACADGHNDVVVLVGNGTTSATARLTATLTWAKNSTHLVGVTAPTMIGQRARISTLTTATVNINPLMSITGNGCIFQNFSFFQGVGQASTDEQLIDISGQRNAFNNIDFGGMGNANGAARPGSYIINLKGGDENTFVGCNIGLETVVRTAANASVLLGAVGSQRNQFIDCLFQMYATQTTPLFLDATLANGLNGSSMWFTRCKFTALQNVSSAAVPAVVTTSNASLNGTVYFDQCSTNATKFSTSGATVVCTGATTSTTGEGGLFVTAS